MSCRDPGDGKKKPRPLTVAGFISKQSLLRLFSESYIVVEILVTPPSTGNLTLDRTVRNVMEIPI